MHCRSWRERLLLPHLRREALCYIPGLTISIAGVTEGLEIESCLGEEPVEQPGPVLHAPELGLDKRGQLTDVSFSQVGQGSLQIRPDRRCRHVAVVRKPA